jgi:ribosomal-protein-alanine N-acetyltransferase
MKVKIKPLSMDHLPSLVEIEIDSFPLPWKAEDFSKFLSSPQYAGFVASVGDEIVGYVIFTNQKNRVCLVSIAVLLKYRRKKIATQLVEELVSQSSKNLYLTLSEKNVDAQVFFKFLGFKAIEVLKNFFGPDHDGYDFVFDSPLYLERFGKDQFFKGA